MYFELKSLPLLLEASKFGPEQLDEMLAVLGFWCRESRNGGLVVNEQVGMHCARRCPDQIQAKEGTAHLAFDYRMLLGCP